MAPVLSLATGMAKHLRSRHRHNINTLRSQPLLELSGAFGDLGTFVPIFVALVSAEKVSGSATLVFSGIANILTGVVFGIPLPVQPMKAIAAIALQKDLTNSEITSAGLLVAGIVGLLSVTGLLNWFIRVVPVPVVKGIQVGTGLSLMISAFASILPRTMYRFWHNLGFDGGLLILALAFLLVCTIHPRIPFVLTIVVLWVLAQLPSIFRQPGTFGIWKPEMLIPTGTEFLIGALSAGLGQLPLTTLNSVLAVVVLAQDLFPTLQDEGSLPSAGRVGISVTLMNVVGLWFRAMPFCHGSGGLAAQYRFGARSGASVIILGLIKLVLGLFAGEFVLGLCMTIKGSSSVVLGLLLFLAGIELARMGQNLSSRGARDLWAASFDSVGIEGEPHTPQQSKIIDDEESMRRWTIMMVTIGSLLGTKNDGIGFVAGMITHWTYLFLNWYRRTGEGNIRLEDGD